MSSSLITAKKSNSLNGFLQGAKRVTTGDPSKTGAIPVIAVTGRGEKMEEVFHREEAFAFFTKPIDLGTLLESVQRALGSKNP